eukprot:scaffold317_cov260-Pinguiococcus_pyrenoidosus.AAC.34
MRWPDASLRRRPSSPVLSQSLSDRFRSRGGKSKPSNCRVFCGGNASIGDADWARGTGRYPGLRPPVADRGHRQYRRGAILGRVRGVHPDSSTAA